MLADTMTFWRRHHTNAGPGVVAQHPNGSFSAGVVPQREGLHGVAQRTGITSLQEAQDRADADVRAKAPHACAAEKCGGWPEQGA